MEYIEGIHYYFEEIDGKRVRIDKIRTFGGPLRVKTRKQLGKPKSEFSKKLNRERFLAKKKKRGLAEKRRVLEMAFIK